MYGGLIKGTLARRGGCGAEALGASIEALPDGAHRGVAAKVACLENKNSVSSE